MLGNYGSFKKDILLLTDIDLGCYEEKQMKRRIDSLIDMSPAAGYDEYIALLKKDKDTFEEFVSFLTINVSEFYRDPDQWRIVESRVVPALIKKFGRNLKIWSAACSTGEEPYSLVMALSRHLPLHQIRIIATDIDRQVLAKAKAGLYNQKSITNVPDDLKRMYFKKIGSSYQISSAIKTRVEFREHNLLRDAYPAECDMIVCRNVMIYFTDAAKRDIYAKFNQALKKNGILFIGCAEQIMNYKLLNYERLLTFFFVRRPG